MDYSLEKLTNQQLDFINARFISPDKDMFSIKTVGAGFNTVIAERVINFILENCSSFYSGNTIVIINDLSLHMTKALIDAGISPKNIKLTFCKFDNKSKTLINNDSAISKIFKLHPVIRQNKDLEIITFEEVQSMKINGIIANPPYAAIGANITDKIRTTVDYDEYINLLPAGDYDRNKNKNLFNYQSDMVCAAKTGTKDASEKFGDADVTTHVAKIHKEKVNSMTLNEFRISQYIDRQLDKFFIENNKRKHYAIDAMPCGNNPESKIKLLDVNTTFLIGHRDMNHKELPTGKDVPTTRWNVAEDIDANYLISICKTKIRNYYYSYCIFNTHEEKVNFVKFIYENRDFMKKVFTAINSDGGVNTDALPKVDWSRQWTVKELLADYGYTENEVQEIIDDLAKYKCTEE